MSCAKTWMEQAKEHQCMEYRISLLELERLQALAERLTHAQVGWLIRLYMEGTLYPSTTDFLDHFVETAGEPPSPAAAAAYNSGNERLIKMADQVEAIGATWFPGSKGERVAMRLEADIKELVDVT